MVFLLVKFIPPGQCRRCLKVWSQDSEDSSYETIIQIMHLFALIYVEGWLKPLLSVVPPVEHRDHRHCCRCRRYSPAVRCQGKSINQPTPSSLKNVNSAPLTHMSQCVLSAFYHVCIGILASQDKQHSSNQLQYSHVCSETTALKTNSEVFKCRLAIGFCKSLIHVKVKF